MAVTFNEGFNGTNGVALSPTNTNFTAAVNAPVFSTAVKKSGTASGHFTTTGSYSYMTHGFSATSKRYWSFYIRPAAAPSGNTVVLFVGTSNDDADRIFQVTLNTDRTIKVQRDSGALIVGSATTGACPLNQWSRIDVSYVDGAVSCALFPGDSNCDKAVGAAAAGDVISGTITNTAISMLHIGVGNGTTNNFYIDDFTEDNAAIPGPSGSNGGGGGTLEPYLYYDNGTVWVDVTDKLHYDNGTSWVQIEGGESVNPPVSTEALLIAGWGSSSILGTGGGAVNVLSELASAFSVTTYNYGYSGDWSFHTAAKMGAIPALVTLPGNVLPGTGSVVVTISNIGNRGNNGTTLTGTLAGVSVSIVYSATNQEWTLTRVASGGSVSMPSNTPLVTNLGSLRRSDTNIIWTGKNDLTYDALAGVQGALDTTRACWDHLDAATSQRLVLGHFLNQNQLSGNARTAIFNVNDAYAVEYGQYFVDVEGFMSSPDVWSRAGVSPTAADLTAQSNRVLPPSLAYDNLHNNAAGYRAIGWLVREHMKSLGWYS